MASHDCRRLRPVPSIVFVVITSISKQQGPQFIFPCTIAIRIPLAMKFDNFSRSREPGQRLKGSGEDLLVARAVIWRPKGAANRMVDENRAGRSHSGHDVQGSAEHERWYLSVFNNVSNETDGLVTKRSVRDQQC